MKCIKMVIAIVSVQLNQQHLLFPLLLSFLSSSMLIFIILKEISPFPHSKYVVVIRAQGQKLELVISRLGL